MFKKILFILITLILFGADYSTAQWSRIGFEDLEIPTIHLINDTVFLPVIKHGNIVFYRSNDNGLNWDSVGVSPLYIYELQNIGDTLFASSNWICNLFCPSGPSVFRSENKGTSWDTVYTNEGGVYNLVANNSILFFREGNQYKKSEDYGTKWITVEFNPPDVGSLFSINGILYSSGMYKSTDNGKTWISIRGNLPVATVVGISANDSFLFAFDNDNIYRSNDDGQTWDPINCGLPSEPRIWNLTISDTCSGLASALNVYFSKNDGENWIDISEGLSLNGYGFINSILIINNYLLAATDEGLWRYNFSPLVSVEEVAEEINLKNYSLEQNYPNPFNPFTTISYSIPNASFVTLKIYDILGREIQILVNEFQYYDSYSVTFNASNLSSGIYFYKLRAGKHLVATKKMLLIR